jgi:hypothetical protein
LLRHGNAEDALERVGDLGIELSLIREEAANAMDVEGCTSSAKDANESPQQRIGERV